MRCCPLSLLFVTVFVALLLVDLTRAEWRPMGRFGKRAASETQESDWTSPKETRLWRPQGRFGRRKKYNSDMSDFLQKQKEPRGWRPQGRFGKRTEPDEESGSSAEWPATVETKLAAEGESLHPSTVARKLMDDVNVALFHAGQDIVCVHVGKRGLYKCLRWHRTQEQTNEI